MATYGTQGRRGLPRRPGGDPWPPAGDDAPVEVAPVAEPSPAVAELVEASSPVADVEETRFVPVAPLPRGATEGGTPPSRTVRRGLPRVPGGEPWPPASSTSVPVPGATTPPVVERPFDSLTLAQDGSARDVTPRTAEEAPPAVASIAASTTPLRRGLPRVAGGEPWPPAGFAPDASAPTPTVQLPEPAASTPVSEPVEAIERVEEVAAPAAASVAVASGPRPPLPFTRTVWQGPTASRFEREHRSGQKITAPEPERIGPFTKVQWAGAVVVGGIGLLFAAFMAVVAVRFLLSTEPLRDFLATYPGEYHLPEGAPVGFPAWLGWQHFFNVFLMVLIIRSGLQVRTEKRPTAFWTPRNDPKGKISLALWFHQSLDILWLVNGVIFVVLLFVTGQWMRVIPTSWEVFPNALSAVLQYISLDWPTENGWVNYNAVQQLAYFATIFIAAPVAAITGVRMTKLWPQNAKTLNRIYPVEWARAVHFPTMIYFCLFIFVHVVLVFATGALRNLNHMYAAQGSTDPNAYADNWAGFWIFFASMVVILGAWIAARPLVLAPIARLFGSVSR